MESEDTLIATFRAELSQAEEEHADATKSVAEWTKKMQNLAFSVQAYKHLIIMRQRKLQADEEEEANAQEQLDGPEVTNTKTSFVLQTIQNALTGVTPAEIKDAGRAAGFDGSSNFPYTTLAKLKAAKRVKEEGGKYFPIQ